MSRARHDPALRSNNIARSPRRVRRANAGVLSGFSGLQQPQRAVRRGSAR